MRNVLPAALAVLILGVCFAFLPKPMNPANLEEKIDEIFADFASLNTPGYAVGILKDGETLIAKGYGAANLDYQLPITPQSAFPLASVSKRFTGACLALLLLDGTLRLDDPVAQYIPAVAQYYPDTLRIWHLGYMSSGLWRYSEQPRTTGTNWISFNHFTIDTALAAALKRKELRFTPGTSWNYTNTDFMLLAKVIEAASGMPLREFARTRIFEPAGMLNTRVDDDITQVIPNRVSPYNYRSSENVDAYINFGIGIREDGSGFIRHPRTSPHYGGSGVNSTIEDLLRWGQHMNEKTFGGEAFHLQYHAARLIPGNENPQAVGLYFSQFEGRTRVQWSGGAEGISTQMVRFPEQGVVIVVLSNLGTGNADGKATEIAQALIEDGIL
ncbi:MAG TPA: hypothetical protein DCE41_17440 [Cytophagales bacterium]|nr:hypothetical protein [Cytophagales bacterium]HAA17500.1 hypothetical protein [Cytophagales bacterium]HAP63108.1 hypothetical protein [Cytophagales bacterium]